MQLSHNAAARIINKTLRHNHITLFLQELHLLPITKRVQFKVLVFTFKAPHNEAPIYLGDVLGLCPKIKDNKCKTRSYYKWRDEDKNRYIEAINSTYIQEQLIDIKNNLSTGDADINETVNTIQTVILEAAAPSKVKSSANRSNTKRQTSLWYDSECNNQRNVYNKLRNKYDSSKSDVDKLNRNEAQKLYVRICKSKSAAYEKEETATFM